MAQKSKIGGFLESIYRFWIKAVSHLQSVFLLIIRLYWGWQFFLTGKGKLMDLDKVTAFFTTIHIPHPHLNAIMAGCTECFGGLLLLLGLGSRIITIPLIFTMVIAYITTEQEALGVLFRDPDKFVSAAPFQFMLAAIIVLIFGPGVFSLDALLARLFFKKAV
jgi:putative oxidoreductase